MNKQWKLHSKCLIKQAHLMCMMMMMMMVVKEEKKMTTATTQTNNGANVFLSCHFNSIWQTELFIDLRFFRLLSCIWFWKESDENWDDFKRNEWTNKRLSLWPNSWFRYVPAFETKSKVCSINEFLNSKANQSMQMIRPPKHMLSHLFLYPKEKRKRK